MNRRRLLPLLITGCSFAVMLSAVACGSGLDDASDSTGSQTDGGGREGERRLGDGGMEEAGAGGNAQTPDGSGTVSAGGGNDDSGQPDRDGDGIADGEDGCPDDPAKSTPGKCGCGVSDAQVCGKLTKEDIQDAFLHTVWGYYFKKEIAQYDLYPLQKYKKVRTSGGTGVDVWSNIYRGSNSRITEDVTPEYGTTDTTLFAVCSTLPYMSMLHSVLKKGKPYSFNKDIDSEKPYYNYASAKTRKLWTLTDNDAVLMRWSRVNFDDSAAYLRYLKSRGSEEEKDLPRKNGWKTHSSYLGFKDYTPERMHQWWSSGTWEAFLEPGDLIVYLRNDGGHVVVYAGNGMIIESTGAIYRVDNKPESSGTNVYETTLVSSKHEADGTFNLYSIKDYTCKDRSQYNVARKDSNGRYVFTEMMVIRPINLMLKKDGSGGFRNEVKADFAMTAGAWSRIQYPGLEVNRTVNLTPYGTAFRGEKVTYHIRVTNHVNDRFQGIRPGESALNEENELHSNISFPDWLRAWSTKRGYELVTDYRGLVVTDVIPKGTTLVDAGDYSFDATTGRITWKIDVPAGQTKTLSYTVEVTDSAGKYLVSRGGSVANIPMNTLRNRIGNGRPVTKDMLEDYYATHSAPERFATQHAFIKDLFETTLLAGSFKSPYRIVSEDLFDRYSYESKSWPPRMAPVVVEAVKNKLHKLDLFIPKDAFETEASFAEGSFRDYLVEGAYGGRRVWTPTNRMRMLELRSSYFMPGDIYVRAVLNTEGKDHQGTQAKWTRMLVYMGDDTYMYYDFLNKQVNKARFQDDPKVLQDALTKDYYFVLRTSQ